VARGGGASRRLASLKARAMGARGGSSREEAVSSQLPFYAAAGCERARFTVSRRARLLVAIATPALRSSLFLFPFPRSLSVSPSTPLPLSLSLSLSDQTAESYRQTTAVIRATGQERSFPRVGRLSLSSSLYNEES